MMTFLRRRFIFTILISLAGVGAAAIMLAATPFGTGLIGDSFYYISGARTLAAGQGMGRITGSGKFAPTTKYPPMLSLVLAAGEVLGLDAVTGARWLNVVLMGLTVILAGIAVWHITGLKKASLYGAILVLASPFLISAYSWAMSEPLYIFLSLAAILLLGVYLRSSRWQWLASSAVLAGCAFLTRYIGGTLVVAALLILVLQKSVPWRKKIITAGLYAVIGLVPMLLWFYRDYALTGNLANRQVAFTPFERWLFSEGAMTVWSWFLPFSIYSDERFAVLATVVFLVFVICLFAFRSRLKSVFTSIGQGLPFIMVVYIIVYAVFLMVSLLFFDPNTPLDQRILSPVYVLVLILIAAGLFRVERTKLLPVRLLATVIGLALLVYYGVTSVGFVQELRKDGQGYANSAFQRSGLFNAVRALPSGVVIYTNNMVGVYFAAGRDSFTVPALGGEDTKSVKRYASDSKRMREVMRGHHGVLVLRYLENLEAHPVQKELLVEGLTLREKFPDGEIYE